MYNDTDWGSLDAWDTLPFNVWFVKNRVTGEWVHEENIRVRGAPYVVTSVRFEHARRMNFRRGNDVVRALNDFEEQSTCLPRRPWTMIPLEDLVDGTQ
jgi:hypothetical protein